MWALFTATGSTEFIHLEFFWKALLLLLITVISKTCTEQFQWHWMLYAFFTLCTLLSGLDSSWTSYKSHKCQHHCHCHIDFNNSSISIHYDMIINGFFLHFDDRYFFLPVAYIMAFQLHIKTSSKTQGLILGLFFIRNVWSCCYFSMKIKHMH